MNVIEITDIEAAFALELEALEGLLRSSESSTDGHGYIFAYRY